MVEKNDALDNFIKQFKEQHEEYMKNPEKYRREHDFKSPIPLLNTMSSDNQYFPLPLSEIDVISIDPIYRKKVIGLAPDLHKNEKIIDILYTLLDTNNPRFIAWNSPYVTPLPINQPKLLEDGTISLEQIIYSLEDFAYDAFLTEIDIYKGAERVEDDQLVQKIIPTDNYMFVSKGDLGIDPNDWTYKLCGKMPEQIFGVLEVWSNNWS